MSSGLSSAIALEITATDPVTLRRQYVRARHAVEVDIAQSGLPNFLIVGLPDAATLVLQGTLFVAVLAANTLDGRWRLFRARTA